MENAGEMNRERRVDLGVPWVGSLCRVVLVLAGLISWCWRRLGTLMASLLGWVLDLLQAAAPSLPGWGGEPFGRTSPSKPWGHSDRAMLGSRPGSLPWFSASLFQFGRISCREKDLYLCSFTLISSFGATSS